MHRPVAAALLPLFALAQQTADAPVVLRSTTRLVQVSVVAHAKDGTPVTDLKQEEFSISEGGRPQKIAFFSRDTAGGTANSGVVLPDNIFSNVLGMKQGVPTSLTIVLLDNLNTAWSDQAQARRQIVRFLQQVRPEDRIALYSLSRGLRVLHDYTTDTAVLIKKLNAYRGDQLPDLASSTASENQPRLEALPGADPLGFDPNFVSTQEANFFSANRTLNTLSALQAIADSVAALPGRKNLVWVSGGFPSPSASSRSPSPGATRRTSAPSTTS